MNSPACIAVTGLGVTTALGKDPESLFRGLLAGQRGLAKIRAFDTTGCRVDIAGEAPDPELPRRVQASMRSAMSRTAALGLHAAAAALEQARLPREGLERVGLVLGSAGGGATALETYLDQLAKPGPGRSRAALMLGFPKRAATDLVAAALSLGGPRATINTACSAGAVAVVHALDLLRAGHADAMLAGGADELTRFTLTGFCSLRAVDPAPCRPFDRARKGMSLGEGAGFMLLERLEDAERRGAEVCAVVAGAGHSCDADHLTAPDPRGQGAAQAMREALATAGVGPAEVAFVNAHGTGTPHNDSAEVQGICDVLGPEAPACPVHTVKASIGHCMGAAGAIEAIVTILSLRDQLVPHTAGLRDPEFEAELDFVRDSPRRISKGYGLSNSFGFGGNNAALLFARPEVRS